MKCLTQKVKIGLLILAILLFVFNYLICEYYYPGISNLKGWWFLKSDNYSIVIMLVLLSSNIGTKGFLRLVYSIGIGFSVADVIDRRYFNSNDFNESDIFLIILVFVLSGIDWFLNSKYFKKWAKI